MIIEADFKQYIKDKIRSEILSWNDENVYAVYIGTSWNNRCDEPLDLPFIIEIGYGSGKKKDWHLACSCQYEKDLFETAEEADALRKWLESCGVQNIGIEDEDNMYDDMLMYVGKGPSGMYETLQTIVEITKELFAENFIRDKFGENIPVIFDDMETTWYCVEATENANPEGLADEYLHKFRMNRKNSREALGFAKVIMGISSIIRIAFFFPCALFAAVITLIFGGIHIPFTVGGIVKSLIVAICLAKRISYMIRLLKTYYSSDSADTRSRASYVLRTVSLILTDTVLAAVILFSCMFLPDRLIAGLYISGVLIYSAIDQLILNKAGKDLMKTRGDEISRSIMQIRKKNGSFGDDSSGNDKDTESTSEQDPDDILKN